MTARAGTPVHCGIAATQDRVPQDEPASSDAILDDDAVEMILASYGLGRE